MEKEVLKKVILIGKYFFISYDKWLLYDYPNKYRIMRTLKRLQCLFEFLNQREELTLTNLQTIRLQIRQWIIKKRPWRCIKSPSDDNVRIMKELRSIAKKEFFLLIKLIEKYIHLFKRVKHLVFNVSRDVNNHLTTIHVLK